jgi:hypothetical protein
MKISQVCLKSTNFMKDSINDSLGSGIMMKNIMRVLQSKCCMDQVYATKWPVSL